MNTTTINNHKALITFDSELGLFRGGVYRIKWRGRFLC
ncbi:Uncharacterised protein [Moraxella caprae]|uniref:Uncharacterized protein n=1 Tax=Moraxella caprae TaxID=90240 RepID=A0A378QZ53_9GAMM|nr:Uncharacterised protein [Moraxella caprae]